MRKKLTVLFITAVVVSLFVGGFVRCLNLVRQRSAQRFLSAVRTVKVGTTNGGEALKVAKSFSPYTYIIRRIDSASEHSTEVVDVPAADCVSGNCRLSFGADAHLGWLRPVFYPLWKWPFLRKRVPISGLSADVTVEHGVVTEVEVEMESIPQEVVQRARTLVTSKPVVPAWNIKRYGAFNTGGPGRTTAILAVTFNLRSGHPNQDIALDFNLNCLHLGRSCSRCEMLPRVCEDDEHGDWDYFEMPPAVLQEFIRTVNRIPFGTSEEGVVRVLGDDANWRLPPYDVDRKSDRLPLLFPPGTISWDSAPERLSYAIRQHREGDTAQQEATVTFTFDATSSLRRIQSGIPGIVNRSFSRLRR